MHSRHFSPARRGGVRFPFKYVADARRAAVKLRGYTYNCKFHSPLKRTSLGTSRVIHCPSLADAYTNSRRGPRIRTNNNRTRAKASARTKIYMPGSVINFGKRCLFHCRSSSGCTGIILHVIRQMRWAEFQGKYNVQRSHDAMWRRDEQRG